MNRIKFNDWQEMALKKDTEKIIKLLNKQEPIIISLTWEIVLGIGAIIVDHFFDTEAISIYVWIICAALAIIPPLIILVVKFAKWINLIHSVKIGKYYTKVFVDTFDNQICYWVMMCNSYTQISKRLSDTQQNEKKFLYQEGCYYINKSIQELNKMQPVIDVVFYKVDDKFDSSQWENGRISLYRLINILDMMNQNMLELAKTVTNLSSDDIISEQNKMNKKYAGIVDAFIDDVNKLFKTELKWEKTYL